MSSNSVDDKAFLSRLTAIVEANLGDENFGVSELADKMKMNRSAVHRKLKSSTKKSVSEFIREIRLEKAKQLLEERSDNISEVAYNVGFGSPSYFSKCFHDYFGYAPAEFKRNQNIGNGTDTVLYESESNGASRIESPKQSSGYRIFKIALRVFILLIVLIFVFWYSEINPGKSNRTSSPNSIAVLPLKNLSNNPDIQYLADGIMEDILSRLSQVDGLVVKSRISSEKIGDKNLSAKEIAKELNVGYFLEGSIIPENDKIRINVQLISAKEDKHVWADHIDKDLTNILPFITEVSGQITEQLEIILSPEEREQVEKIYTENKKAYKLYLEGRFYYQLRTKETFEKSIDLYNQALALDSGFCLAYAGLADIYLTGTWAGFYHIETGFSISRAFALKALKIDNNLPEALTTLGGIAIYFDYDWDTAENELKRALRINPGYVRAMAVYSELMDVTGNREMARRYINDALVLNPASFRLVWLSYFYYMREGNWDQALEESKKAFYLEKDEPTYYWRNFLVYLLQDNISAAVDSYIKSYKAFYPNGNPNFIENSYKEDGYEGFMQLVISRYKKDKGPLSELAELYAFIYEKNSALTCLEKSFGKDPSLARIKYDPFFKDIKTDPRFIVLLRKMNLADD